MNLFSKLNPEPVQPVGAVATQNEVQAPRAQSVSGRDDEKTVLGTAAAAQERPSSNYESDSDDELVHKNAQWGVQKAEAMCQAWSKKWLITTYIL